MRIVIVILSGFFVFLVFSFISPAYGAFDQQGNYYCDPTNMELEKIIYQAAVAKINYEVDSYLSLNPDPVYQQFRDYVIHTSSGTAEPTYDIMNKAQKCLVLHGIDPHLIASPINLVLQTGYAPEFGTLSSLVALVSITGVIALSKIFMKSKS